MNYSGEEMFNLLRDREQHHSGGTFVCEKCGRDGVVGKDLVAAASTATTQRGVWCWWVHESCAKEYMEKYQ